MNWKISFCPSHRLVLEAYSPQVIIKSRLDPPLLAEDYFLQCNARGNPLPRLYWTKENLQLEYLPNSKQCFSKSCRIYSIQSKYQSTLYFHSISWADSGVYNCRTSSNGESVEKTVFVDFRRGESDQYDLRPGGDSGRSTSGQIESNGNERQLFDSEFLSSARSMSVRW